MINELFNYLGYLNNSKFLRISYDNVEYRF